MLKGHTVFVLFPLHFLEHPPRSSILPRFLQPPAAEVSTEPQIHLRCRTGGQRGSLDTCQEITWEIWGKGTWSSPCWPHWLEIGQISLCECTADLSLEQCSETAFRHFSCWFECPSSHVNSCPVYQWAQGKQQNLPKNHFCTLDFCNRGFHVGARERF